MKTPPQVFVFCEEIYDRIWCADYTVTAIASAVPEPFSMTGLLIGAFNKLQS
ncbi:hypothetical protein [Phaeobacter sp. J2-8]|uniref:hypothetical protein n=1 Tax=Phaeobacter sp. J2-8 TaxID=2931394 RepID=UPI001FD0D959|nr:hypothetical protein [Phaeobacter sp. J2-8]MCJ7871013.1 hypothetical protein [Phaeobacter sp. J2-8]